MANSYDNSTHLQKQITLSVDTIDELTLKIHQLDGLIDLLSVAVDPKNTAVFKQDTLNNITWVMQDLIDKIKDIFVKQIAES